MPRARPLKTDVAVLKGDADDAKDNRAINRLKNINLTKLHASYERYLKTVPRDLRLSQLSDSWHPVTPDHRSRASISQWNREISAWRKKVYLWNTVTEGQCGQLTESVEKGDVDGFLDICTKKVETVPSDDGYSRLLDPKHSAGIIAPVLYKPSWFKGHITHSGFQTIDEKEFLDRATAIHRKSDDHFKQFYEEYIQSYTDKKVP